MATRGQESSDAMIQMFFDPAFEPEEYLNALLSGTTVQHKQQRQETQPQGTIQTLKDLQPIANSLISKFDFYTTNLTREFEKNVTILKDPVNDMLISGSKKTKLEFYLDTLNNSITSLESEVVRLNKALETGNIDAERESTQESSFLENLENLETIKSRLLNVLDCFNKINEVVNPDTHQQVTVSEFKEKLLEKQDQITTALRALPKSQDSEAYLESIQFLVDLKQVFKNFDMFHPIYTEFSLALKKELNDYKTNNSLN